MNEAHDSIHVIHPDEVKMYKGIKEKFWWTSMKNDVSKHIHVSGMSRGEGRASMTRRATSDPNNT